MMVLYALSVIIFLFVSFTLFYHAHIPAWLKVAGTALILFVSLKYVVYQIVGGAFFSPDLPRLLIIVMEALYGSLLLLFFLLLLWDFYLLVNWGMSRLGIPVPAHLPKGYIKLGLIALALCLGAYGTWQTICVPDVASRHVRLANLPCSLNGFRLVQLTDLHLGPILKQDWLDEVVRKVNALEPDLVVLTGDYVDGYADRIGHELQPLGNLASKYGIFAVTGNHEYYWNVTEWEEVIESLGIEWLNNSHKTIEAGEDRIVIAGISDLAAERHGYPAPDLEKALKGAPEAVRILLSHQPKNALNDFQKVDLQLSGHTHGGVMFFLQPIVAMFNNGFVQGLYPENGKALYVSPGTGLWNGFSCRVGVPPEITLLTLDCAAAEKDQEKPLED